MTSYIPAQNVKFNKHLSEIEQQPDKVVLRFADDEVFHASVLVGADGIKSVVREHVLKPLNPSQADPVYANSYCYRGVIPISEAKEILGDLTDVAKFYFGYKQSAVTYRISDGQVSRCLRPSTSVVLIKRQELNFLLCKATDAPWPLKHAMTEQVTHKAMMADFDSGIDHRLRRLLSKAKPIRWGLFHHLHTSTYYHNRVILMGDSAHASLPFQAAGAAQGVEDAVVLSHVLAQVSAQLKVKASAQECIRASFDAYDSVRRPRAQKQLEQSDEVARMLFFQHEQAGDDMTKILPMLQQGRFEWLWFHDIEEDVRTAMAKPQSRETA